MFVGEAQGAIHVSLRNPQHNSLVRRLGRPHNCGWRQRLRCGIFARATVVIWVETCRIAARTRSHRPYDHR